MMYEKDAALVSVRYLLHFGDEPNVCLIDVLTLLRLSNRLQLPPGIADYKAILVVSDFRFEFR